MHLHGTEDWLYVTLIVHFIYHSSEVFNQEPSDGLLAAKIHFHPTLSFLSLGVNDSLFTLAVLAPLIAILPEAASDPEEYLWDDQEEGDDDEEEGGHPGVPRWSAEQLIDPHCDGLERKS